jgi:hypothetical protein
VLTPMLVCVAGFYTQKLALRRVTATLSRDRQSRRLTRCVTEHELVCAVGLEPTLYGFSNRSLCHWGTRTYWKTWRTRWDSNPRRREADGLRDRSLCRSGHWSKLEDVVGLAPTMRRQGAHRIKSPGRSLLRSHVQNVES